MNPWAAINSVKIFIVIISLARSLMSLSSWLVKEFKWRQFSSFLNGFSCSRMIKEHAHTLFNKKESTEYVSYELGDNKK
jgi:hypothetical protein